MSENKTEATQQNPGNQDEASGYSTPAGQFSAGRLIPFVVIAAIIIIGAVLLNAYL